MRFILGVLFGIMSVAIMNGCVMISAWKSIPPPGGCDQCHTAAISNDWKVAYQAPILTDERNRDAFQTATFTMPQAAGQPASSLEVRKVQDLKCFECHRTPNAAHRGRVGRFHH